MSTSCASEGTLGLKCGRPVAKITQLFCQVRNGRFCSWASCCRMHWVKSWRCVFGWRRRWLYITGKNWEVLQAVSKVVSMFKSGIQVVKLKFSLTEMKWSTSILLRQNKYCDQENSEHVKIKCGVAKVWSILGFDIRNEEVRLEWTVENIECVIFAFYQEDNMIQQGVFVDRYPHSFTDGSGARKSVEIESSRQSTDSKTRITKAIYCSVQQKWRFHCHCRLSSRSTFWRSIMHLREQWRVSGR